MNIFGIFKREEKRTEGTENAESAIASALLGSGAIDKARALQIPSVTAAIDKLANTVAKLPLKLYKEQEGKKTEVIGDRRTFVFNKDTGDTLSTVNFWKAILEDYFLDKGGYAYIDKTGNVVHSIRYVDATRVQVAKSNNAIFKDYDIYVNGIKYYPFEFIKLLRKTKDGCKSVSVCEENSRILAVAYNTLVFEDNLVKKNGNKRGFYKSKNKLSEGVIAQLKKDISDLYNSESSERALILNEGMDFRETSATSVELQLNENKLTNSDEIFKIFGFPSAIVKGGATEEDKKLFADCVVDLLNVIEAALDKDLLLECEKEDCFFAFDTRELTRGNTKERYEAYRTAIEAHFMQPEEIRKLEDMEPMGFDYMSMGLGEVFYNPKAKTIFVPNTGKTFKLDETEEVMKENESGNQN